MLPQIANRKGRCRPSAIANLSGSLAKRYRPALVAVTLPALIAAPLHRIGLGPRALEMRGRSSGRRVAGISVAEILLRWNCCRGPEGPLYPNLVLPKPGYKTLSWRPRNAEIDPHLKRCYLVFHRGEQKAAWLRAKSGRLARHDSAAKIIPALRAELSDASRWTAGRRRRWTELSIRKRVLRPTVGRWADRSARSRTAR